MNCYESTANREEKLLKVAIISLAFNEVDTIAAEISLWREICSFAGFEPTIYIAEDGSTDGTSELLQELQSAGSICHLYSPSRRGYKGALIEAFRTCEEEYVLFVDSGNKFLPEDLKIMLARIGKADLVIGERKMRTDSKLRIFLSHAYSWYCKVLFNDFGLRDVDSGLRVYSRKVINRVILGDLLFPELIGSEILIRASKFGFKIEYIPVGYRGRDGESRGLPTKKIPRKVLSILKKSWTLRVQLKENSEFPATFGV